MTPLGGVLPTLPTPFHCSSWDLDLDTFRDLLHQLIDGGVHGFVVGGTGGEGPSLTRTERRALLELIRHTASDRPVVCGVATCGVTEAVEQAAEAEELGAAGLLVVPPYFFPSPPEEGLVEFYRRILDATRLPVILDHHPQISGVEITDHLLEALQDHPNLLGVKDSSGDRHRMLEYRRRFPDMALYSGSDDLADFALSQGACGCISSLANLAPRLMTALFAARAGGEQDAAAAARVDRLRQVLSRYPLRQAIKFALTLLDLPLSSVRPPLVDLPAKQRSALAQELVKLGFPAD